MRYIGSKERLLAFIEHTLRSRVGKASGCAGDVFCGTAAVSRMLKNLGYKVLANDNLRLGYVFAQAALNVNTEPQFGRLIKSGEVSNKRKSSPDISPYDQVLTRLNSLPSREGFFFREYAPGGENRAGLARGYFSDRNAMHIDAIRGVLKRWHKELLLTDIEHCLLLADLMIAANKVANIAGTYGCFMKKWDQRAARPLLIERSVISPGRKAHEVQCGDAATLVEKRKFDVLYLDPPYTWRHYGAYYHILETIAHGDDPVVDGVTGLRPWKDTRSRFCDRGEAASALRDMVGISATANRCTSPSHINSS